MISPVSNAHPVDARQHVAQPAAEVRPDPQAETRPVRKSGQVSQDQVTLQSAGQVDHEK